MHGLRVTLTCDDTGALFAVHQFGGMELRALRALCEEIENMPYFYEDRPEEVDVRDFVSDLHTATNSAIATEEGKV